MSVVRAVTNYVVMQRRTDSNAVMRAFPHLPRATVQKAIQNAAYQGHINVERRGKGGWDSSPAILSAPLPDQPKLRGPERPRVRNPRVRVASVWELGEPKHLDLPGEPGRRYSPLGPWTDPEGAAA
jgi:hypothetical protein